MNRISITSIRERMLACGVTQFALAREAGVSRQEVNRWINEKRHPTTDNLLRLWWALERLTEECEENE